ncbi:MAG: hypothetical protein JWM59_2292 [Verrucomicrobiales bacterium]|nr:hypothetical protein [Verrucomicrobiales bacterium]
MASVLLVDDAAPDEGIGRELLKNQPDLRILGTAANVSDALDFVGSRSPDFVYVRWEMAGKLEAAALNFLTTRSRVVFVTPFGSHLVHTMQSGPPEPDRMAEPPFKAFSNPEFPVPSSNGHSQITTAALEAVRRVDSHGRTEIVPIDKILWIEAAQNYTKVQKMGDSPGTLFHRSMVAWERILPSYAFLRLSRSVIVHVPSIEILTCKGRDSTTVSFTGSKRQLRLGRTAALRLKAWFRHPH